MFTTAQLKAINATGKDVLVSAGAGSGKTTVLTRRIMEKLSAGYDLSDFLIVTFTKASAADLRKKLGKKLGELAKDNPDDARYRKMLYALPAADIGTIDSFCLKYVKENAPKLGLYKGAAVGDDALCEALLDSTADALITELCEEEDERIDLLLDNFASFKDDAGLIKVFGALYRSLRKYPFYLSWLKEAVEKHEAEATLLKEKGFFACSHSALVKRTLEKQLATAREYLNTMHVLAESDIEAAFAADVEAVFAPLEAGFAHSYSAYRDAANAYKIRSRPSKTSAAFTAAYNGYKAILDARAKLLRTDEELLNEYEYTGKVIKALAYAMERLDAAYSTAKTERGIIDFPDAEQLFLSLLLEQTEDGFVKTPLCRSISGSYKEVFIDEYQDVSPLQDAIFKALGSGKRFMVGDVKQSIYGFREAYPDIFMGYRDSFDGTVGETVYLTDNFRCDEPIINFCNYLFDRTFTLSSAETDYKKERLERGKKESGNAKVILSVLEEGEVEKEAEYVAEQIVKCIYEGYEPSQIAILCRETADILIAINALEKRGVPCVTEKTNEALLKQPEVLLALSLLKAVDNPTDDISLAALLRSPIFRFSAEELVRIRACKGTGTSFYNNVTAAAKEETPLGEKCAAFLSKLSLYRTKALIMPVHSLLWYLYEDSHIFAFAPEGKEKRYRDNLFLLYEMAKGMESNSYKGLSVFVEYVTDLEREERSPNAAKPAAEDAVSLMTIHSSKGLEFPVVFVMGTGCNIKKKHRQAPMAVNYRAGISVRLADQKRGLKTSTVLRNAAIAEQDRKTVAEEYRLLYVAFTRAEQRLYISAALKKTLTEYLEKQKEEPSLQADLFLPTLAAGGDDSYSLCVLEPEAEIPTTVLAGAMARAAIAPVLPPIGDDPPAPARTTAKYAVSQVIRRPDGTLGTDTARLITDREPVFVADEKGKGARIGTATHAFMQFADYKGAEKDLAAEADRLLRMGFISPEDRALLDEEALRRFFRSPLYAEIKGAAKLYREKRFTTELPADLFGAEGEQVLVQGVIDCFYQGEDGSFTLVDYKTDRVKKGEESLLAERYGTQLYLYSLYISKLTGQKVTKAYIYSLCLDKAIPCEIEKYGI